MFASAQSPAEEDKRIHFKIIEHVHIFLNIAFLSRFIIYTYIDIESQVNLHRQFTWSYIYIYIYVYIYIL